jgi:hypothetical protein
MHAVIMLSLLRTSLRRMRQAGAEMPRCCVSSLANCSLCVARRAGCAFTMSTRSGACRSAGGDALPGLPLRDRPLHAHGCSLSAL